MNCTWFYSRNHWWAWRSSGHKQPSIWGTTPATSCPSWRTPKLATCTRQVTRTDRKQRFILIKVGPVFIFISPLAPRWVWEVLQRRGAHGSLGRTARSERFRAVYWGAPHASSFDNSPVPVVPFQLRALTQVLQLPIDVVQSSSAAIKIGEEFDGEPITLVYVIASIAAIRTIVVDMVVDVTICMNPCVGLCPQVHASRVWTRRALQFCGAAKGPG